MFQREVETILSDYNGGRGSHDDFNWEILAGVGSTSTRYLIRTGKGTSGRSFVLKRFQISGGNPEESKIQASREYEALLFLKDLKSTVWHTPLPIALIAEHAIIIMEYFDGISINKSFWDAVRWHFISRKNISWLIDLIQNVSKIILEMQSLDRGSCNLMSAGGVWYSSFLEDQLSELSDLGLNSELSDTIRKKFNDALPDFLSKENQCFQHTDLYFNNILYGNGVYCVLDLPNACWGSRYWDISHMLVSLDDYKLFRNVDHGIIDECKREVMRHFILDHFLIDTMQLLHTCFSCRLNILAYNGYKRKILSRDPGTFFKGRLNSLIKEL